MLGSWLRDSMRASSAFSVKSSGYFSSKECKPLSWQALTLLRTYTWLAGFSPTKITAKPGVMPLALSAAVRLVTSARSFCERAFPSILCAVIVKPCSRVVQVKTPARLMFTGVVRKARPLGFGCVLTQCNFEQICHGIGIQLFHDVGPVRFNGFDADA